MNELVLANCSEEPVSATSRDLPQVSAPPEPSRKNVESFSFGYHY